MKKTNICKSGQIKCNRHPFWGAALTMFRPGYGIIRVAFGSGDNLTEDDMNQCDKKGNKINDYLYITVYTSSPKEGVYTPEDYSNPRKNVAGMLFEETDGGQLLFSRKSWPNGDIREMLPEAFDFMGWPRDVKGYFLLGYEGQFCEFCNKPLPMGENGRHV